MKSEHFTEATKRNALRREEMLPLINVRSEMELMKYVDELRAYAGAVVSHNSDQRRIYEEVLAEKRAEHGSDYGVSAGGRNFVSLVAQKRFEEFLAAKGFAKPVKPGPAITYGEAFKAD